MLERERQDRIVARLAESAFAPVGELVTITGASEATVRRDLGKLEEAGLLKRIRGGAQMAGSARPNPGLGEAPLSERNIQNREGKRRIAEYAVSLCTDNELIFVDGGSTTFLMGPLLRSKRLQVVTNSFALADALTRPLVGALAGTHPTEPSEAGSCSVLLPGGVLYPDSGLILDPFGNSFYENFEADKAFLGAGAVTVKGIENRDIRVIREERRMIAHARKTIVLADSEKFTRTGSLLLCRLDRITTIVTDSGIPEGTRRALLEAEVGLVIV